MRGVLIGCGFFARNHLNAWRDMRADGVELVAVADIDAAKAEAAARDFGIPRAYRDAEEMLAREKPDFVDIATRMDTHEALVTLALRSGARVIVQKPFAPDWAGCCRMVAAAQAAGLPLAVHENFRYQAPMLAISRTLASGIIGAPTWARLAFRTGFDVYATQPYFRQEERLVILDVGIHILDLARVFLGEVTRLSCETQRRSPANRAEDTATMLLRHDSGAVSVVESTYEALDLPDAFPQTLVWIEGERGALRLDAAGQLHVTTGPRGALSTVTTDATSPLLSWTAHPWHVAQESVLVTQRAILKAWREGREAETSGADNLRTFALVEAAYRSAAEGRAVPPEAPPV